MEFEFDKEMDSLLRQTAKGENVSAAENPSGEHIDADEISMFAENALPEKAKPRVMKHLADCNRCRTILSNVIALNSEAEISAVSVQESKAETIVGSHEPNWFQKLFSTRNLAFGMGALALIFAVGIGFILIQNATNSVSELAQAPKASNTNASSADNSAATDVFDSLDQDSANSNATTMSENTTVFESNENLANSNSATNSPTQNELRDTKESPQDNAKKDIGETFAKNKPNAVGTVRDETTLSAEKAPATEMKSRVENDDVASAADKTVEESESNSDREMANPASPPPPVATRKGVTKSKKIERAREDAQGATTLSKPPATSRTINGKTFNRRDNVWYDSAYKNQSTTNVRRKTTQYNKLDSGLRSITDKLDGTVVIVWKSKAYRIQ